jgi:UDP-N-acetylmuramoyl-L-alanyl-D-glutamate--2,6-diaminopimelate ligase
MSLLKDILYKVSLVATAGDMEIDINKIEFDSRKVEPGDLFVAIKGTLSDGHEFIHNAIEKGAIAVVCEKLPEHIPAYVTFVKVTNSAESLGFMSANYYNNPSEELKLIAVTGTNGKTTVVTLLHQLFSLLGYNTGMISTVENKIRDRSIRATHTTPDALQLNRLIRDMVKQGCTHCFIEASSHAIEQKRISGLDIDIAVFTNISHDHLDYHGSFDAYIKAKKQLFDNLRKNAMALTNNDDKRGKIMVQNTNAKVETYGIKNPATFKARLLSNTMEGLELDIEGTNAWFPLIGEYNAYNILVAYAVASLLGENPEDVLQEMSRIDKIPGRFEKVYPESGIFAIVDYAHTPDALKKILTTLDGLRSGNEKLITVVGCGGNRDKAKRPEMASIACQFSDKVIFTSDNPRDEDPDDIIKDMKKGVAPQQYRKTTTQVDRKEAIKLACSMAEQKDLILIAGKGHERYQEIKGQKYDFDDRVIVREMLELMEN